MTPAREILVDLFLNGFVQISLFAIVAAGLSRVVARASAKYQYIVYLAVFLLCLVVPVVNTFWKSPPVAAVEHSVQQIPAVIGAGSHGFWNWRGPSSEPQSFVLGRSVQNWLISIWGLLVLYRMVRLARAVYRAYRIRSDASWLSPVVAEMARGLIDARHRVSLLESASVQVPATIGIFRPLIFLPRQLVPQLNEQELRAALAHEYAHVLRRDFAIHLLFELISLPVRWHPGVSYLMSKISQTRELACDDHATRLLGTRRPYANALLRLASLCLPVPRGNAATELGIFDGDNLEDRIMMLTKKRVLLSRAGATALLLAAIVAFGGSAVLARAVSFQTSSKATSPAKNFAGTWHWMFNKKSFATMILNWDGSRFTGSVTQSRIALNDDGTLSMADPSNNGAPPSPISEAKLEGSQLHVTVRDGNDSFAFTVTLKDENHAEIHPVGAPANMKPIAAERVL